MRNKVIPLLLGFVAVVSQTGAAQTAEYVSTLHVFPQFVDGTADGQSYVSTIQISAAEPSFGTQCSLGLLSMSPATLADARGSRQTGTVFNFILAPAGWQIVQSLATRSLQAGSATLQCDRPVTAHLIHTLNRGPAVVSEATSTSAPAGRVVQILADQRRNARLGIAIVNPFSITAAYRISVFDIEARLLHSTVIQIPSTRSFTRFLDEFAAVPRDFRGPVIIEALSGVDVYAAGSRFTEGVFTSIPATVRIP